MKLYRLTNRLINSGWKTVTFGEVHTRTTSCDLKTNIDFLLAVQTTNIETQVSKVEITLKWLNNNFCVWKKNDICKPF